MALLGPQHRHQGNDRTVEREPEPFFQFPVRGSGMEAGRIRSGGNGNNPLGRDLVGVQQIPADVFPGGNHGIGQIIDPVQPRPFNLHGDMAGADQDRDPGPAPGQAPGPTVHRAVRVQHVDL